MTWQEIVDAASTLSDEDKLKVIEGIVHMLPGGETAKEAPTAYEAERHPAEEDEAARKERLQTWLNRKPQSMAALLEELFSRPDPTPDQMLPYGLFEGQLQFDEEDFKAAEWHPTDEELENAGLSSNSLRD